MAWDFTIEHNNMIGELDRRKAEIDRMRDIMAAIYRLVHIPTPGHMKAYTHFQRDFDQIRSLTKPFTSIKT